MLLSVGIASAQEKIKINDVIYVIDHKIVASSLFDGSQLVNKTIASYQVDSELGLHIIFTSDYTKEKNVYQTKVVTKDDGITVVSYDKKGNTVASTNIVAHPETVHVVDGKVMTADEFMAISPSKIESIIIVKRQSGLPEIREGQYGGSYDDHHQKIISRISFINVGISKFSTDRRRKGWFQESVR